MKKIVFLVSTCVILLSLVAGPVVMAAGKNGPAGKSNVGHLYLYEKDTVTWQIVEDGAWGKMKYKLSGPTFDFVFNGHELKAEADYTLIYYPDPWPGNGLICLGSGTANADGNVHVIGSVDTGDLPAGYDLNSDPETTTDWAGRTGAKIWLVLSDDVDCENAKMIGWTPAKYLFEFDLITFNAD